MSPYFDFLSTSGPKIWRQGGGTPNFFNNESIFTKMRFIALCNAYLTEEGK